jgi:hypothetical protein
MHVISALWCLCFGLELGPAGVLHNDALEKTMIPCSIRLPPN